MFGSVTKTQFDWVYTDEPHASRRKLILEKHPEIKDLFGLDPSFPYVVTLMVLTQIVVCWLLKDSDWTLIMLEAYFFGGVVNHSLTLAIHEIGHNMAFGMSHPLKNRFFGIFANLPIGIPMSISFKKYHLEHHRYMGEDGLDTDIPTELEGKLFTNTITKCVWLVMQPLFYAFRPLIVYKKTPTDMEVVNAIVQIAFDLAIYKMWGVKSLFFLIFGTLVSMGFHPTAGHFISEHYVVKSGQETYSYHGPMNLVTFNVGYHVEHHDFPYISGRQLPLVKGLAPEWYDTLMHHDSWVFVLYNFLTNPSVGPYARMKRPRKGIPEMGGKNLLLPYATAVFHYLGGSLIVDAVPKMSKRLLNCFWDLNGSSEPTPSLKQG